MKVSSVVTMVILGAGVALAAPAAPEHDYTPNALFEDREITCAIGDDCSVVNTQYPGHGMHAEKAQMTTGTDEPKSYIPIIPVKKTTLITVASSNKDKVPELTPTAHEAAIAEAEATKGPVDFQAVREHADVEHGQAPEAQGTEGSIDFDGPKLAARETICLTENVDCATNPGSIVKGTATSSQSGLTPADGPLTPTTTAPAATTDLGCNEAPDGQIACETSAPAATAAPLFFPILPAAKREETSTLADLNGAGTVITTDSAPAPTPAAYENPKVAAGVAIAKAAAASVIAAHKKQPPILPAEKRVASEQTVTAPDFNGNLPTLIVTDTRPAPSPAPKKKEPHADKLLDAARVLQQHAATMKKDTLSEKVHADAELVAANMLIHKADGEKAVAAKNHHTKRA